MDDQKNIADIYMQLTNAHHTALSSELEKIIQELEGGTMISRNIVHNIVQRIEKTLCAEIETERIKQFRTYIYGLTGNNITINAIKTS